MLIGELIGDGNLQAALDRAQQQVRAEPADAKHRIFLFQLYAVTGQWERCLTQLNVLAEMDAGTLAMAQAYKAAIPTEPLRKKVFDGERSPLLFGQPERWMALLVQALHASAPGNAFQAQQLRDEAFEAAPATPGTIETAAGEESRQSFSWIADADMRLGPMLEAVVDGKYYWIPFHRVREIRLDPPADLRDVVWMPAQLEWTNGGQTVGLIPTRYPGSDTSDDDQIRLARKTEWIEPAAGVYVGLGQRMLATDGGEFPLMDIRRIVLETAPVLEAPAGNGAAAE
ncbi:MAG: virulence protein SciE type [Planctomycetes bacterium]|nr:virulence protein SciE type [Planctomycetota bacterium]